MLAWLTAERKQPVWLRSQNWLKCEVNIKLQETVTNQWQPMRTNWFEHSKLKSETETVP